MRKQRSGTDGRPPQVVATYTDRLDVKVLRVIPVVINARLGDATINTKEAVRQRRELSSFNRAEYGLVCGSRGLIPLLLTDPNVDVFVSRSTFPKDDSQLGPTELAARIVLKILVETYVTAHQERSVT
jgi:hypothetical protein